MSSGYAAWAPLAAVAAGSLGAVLRWACVAWWHGVLAKRTSGPDPFPAGVLLANTIASFIAGVLLPVAAVVGTSWRLVIVAGLCGGLSTLSTLAVDTVAMWQRGQHRSALGNALANIGLGVAAAALGTGVLGQAIAAALSR